MRKEFTTWAGDFAGSDGEGLDANDIVEAIVDRRTGEVFLVPRRRPRRYQIDRPASIFDKSSW